MGQPFYPNSQHLLITADCGGSNGYRTRLWRLKLQELATEIGKTIHVCHFPPGTSKWNKIEHRLFSQITQNWRGKPLTSLQVVVNLIRHTRTKAGLSVRQSKFYENHRVNLLVCVPRSFSFLRFYSI